MIGKMICKNYNDVREVITMKKLQQYIKLYFWAIKESYSFMQGLRDFKFWLKLPFKAHWIAYKTVFK